MEHYPTYILFRPDGTRATPPDREPKPYNSNAVREAVLKALGRE